MILKKEKLKILLLLFILSTYAYLVNWYSANIGVLPIDTFGFMDSSNSVIKGHLPIRDFWIFTGLLLDYMYFYFILKFQNQIILLYFHNIKYYMALYLDDLNFIF